MCAGVERADEMHETRASQLADEIVADRRAGRAELNEEEYGERLEQSRAEELLPLTPHREH